MLRGDVVLLGRIHGEIEELIIAFGCGGRRFRIERARRSAVEATADEFPGLRIGTAEVSDEFPLVHADELCSAALRELAVEELAGLLRAAEEGGGEADAVEVRGRGGRLPAQFEQRRQPVLESGDPVAARPWLDPPRPAHDRRYAEAAVVDRALAAAEDAAAVEVARGDAAGRAVVAHEDEDRVLVEAQLAHQAHDAADLAIHPRDHRRVS